MVPLRLRLYNFLSYRGETELDLRGIHVGCLSGDNGNGKSALLDAMTWALWGWARGRRYGAGGTSPDDLVHQGEADMEVALTFGAGAATYRIVRKHSRGGGRRGAARMVDLQSDTGEGFKSLTEGSVAETEEQVQRLLHMNYDTFVNSAFLLQGEADRFTTSRPAQRKETLAHILGLALYERLQERARERARTQDALLLRNDLDRDAAERDLNERPAAEGALDAAQQALEGLTPRLSVARAAEAALDARAAALDGVRQEADRLRDTARSRAAEAERVESQAEQARSRAARFEEALSRRDEIEGGASRLAVAQGRARALEEDRRLDDALQRQALELRHVIAQAADRLQADADRLRDRAERDLRPRVEDGRAARTSLIDAERAEDDLEPQREAVQARERELGSTVRAIERLEEANKGLRAEMEDLRGGVNMLAEGETACPLCGTLLGAEGLAHVRRERERQGRELRTQFNRNAEELKGLTPQRGGLETAFKHAQAELESAQRGLAERAAALRRQAEDGDFAESELALVEEELAALTHRIAEEDFAQTERDLLADVGSQQRALAYDADAHAAVRDAVHELEPYAELARDLRDAEERLPLEQAALEEYIQQAKARRSEVKEAERRLAEIAGQLEGAPALHAELDAKGAERRDLEAREADLRATAQLHALRLEQLATREADLAAMVEAHRELQAARDSYGVLVDAFGRGGIQALLIEAALPELEAQANRLLAQLTDHRMTLSLETQRQNRRGDVSETLEIRIADELGTRNYELFSGGEAFRIDFAIRIALAKLLASRAGAPLRTLFIDEGFGTQDPGGRERLVEAIQSIQEEFDLILVVTHVEEMKEAFPVRIDVSKDERGSSLEVVWA